MSQEVGVSDSAAGARVSGQDAGNGGEAFGIAGVQCRNQLS